MGVRTVMQKPFTFHDGLTIPVGTRIAYPTLAIMRDPDTFGPLKFDGFRFANLDGVNELNESAKGASTVSTTNLA
jgi:cytochrome P450